MTRSSIILAPFGVLYSAMTRTRLALYQRGLLPVSKLDAPVISVGNITAGGSGKTPLVEHIARTLAAANRKVCILTRGYGRENPAKRVLVSDGHTVSATAEEAGDEPRLLAENLRGIAAVISDADRFAAGQWAIRELGTDVFILDDGFQHLRLARDLNVATIDATDAWGGGRLLPRGQLREPRGGLARADCVLITRADQAVDIDSIKREVDILSNHRPLFTSSMVVRALRKLGASSFASESHSPPDMAAPVAAFCGIGNPRAFIRQLENCGYKAVAVSQFSDHHRYDQSDLDRIIDKARHAGARSLITTAKDGVKLGNLSFALPCYVLDIEIRIEEGARFFEMIQAAVRRGS